MPCSQKSSHRLLATRSADGALAERGGPLVGPSGDWAASPLRKDCVSHLMRQKIGEDAVKRAFENHTVPRTDAVLKMEHGGTTEGLFDRHSHRTGLGPIRQLLSQPKLGQRLAVVFRGLTDLTRDLDRGGLHHEVRRAIRFF